ncbi:MAG: cytochrome c [Crocinitomicaceae bacterium]
MKKLGFAIALFTFSCNSGDSTSLTKDEEAVNTKYAEGKEVYDRSCIACHMKDGKGLEGTFPPLAASDYLLKDPQRALKQVLYGSDEQMTVNGVEYHGIMPPQDVSEEEAVAVVNYILNAWGNDGGEITESDLEKIKE